MSTLETTPVAAARPHLSRLEAETMLKRAHPTETNLTGAAAVLLRRQFVLVVLPAA